MGEKMRHCINVYQIYILGHQVLHYLPLSFSGPSELWRWPQHPVKTFYMPIVCLLTDVILMVDSELPQNSHLASIPINESQNSIKNTLC
jgi:hypothetical protein